MKIHDTEREICEVEIKNVEENKLIEIKFDNIFDENIQKNQINNTNNNESIISDVNLIFPMNILVKSLLIMATKLRRNMTYTDAETVVK